VLCNSKDFLNEHFFAGFSVVNFGSTWSVKILVTYLATVNAKYYKNTIADKLVHTANVQTFNLLADERRKILQMA